MAARTAESGRFRGLSNPRKPAQNRTPHPEMLRLGIVHSGRIVEEQLIRPGRSVTVGEHPRATVVVPRAELPDRRYALFGAKGAGWELRFTPAMRGKLSVDGEVVSLEALLQRGEARRRRAVWTVPLDARTRGKVHVGDYTFLFQLVPPPPLPARGPRRLRLRRSAPDYLFLAILVLSALLHTAAVVWIDTHPPPARIELADLSPGITKLVFLPPPALELEDPAVDDEATPEPETEATPAPATLERSESAAPPEPTPRTTPRSRDELKQELIDGGWEAILIPTVGAGKGNPVADLLYDESSFREVQEAMVAGTVSVARVRDPGLRVRDGDDGLATDGSPTGVGGGEGGTLVKAHRGPAVTEQPVVVDAPPSVATSIREVLRPYRGRIKACYERELKTLPDLAGKLTLSWVISPVGAVESLRTDVNTTGSGELDACVRRWIRRATFPETETETYVDGYPLVFSPS